MALGTWRTGLTFVQWSIERRDKTFDLYQDSTRDGHLRVVQCCDLCYLHEGDLYQRENHPTGPIWHQQHTAISYCNHRENRERNQGTGKVHNWGTKSNRFWASSNNDRRRIGQGSTFHAPWHAGHGSLHHSLAPCPPLSFFSSVHSLPSFFIAFFTFTAQFSSSQCFSCSFFLRTAWLPFSPYLVSPHTLHRMGFRFPYPFWKDIPLWYSPLPLVAARIGWKRGLGRSYDSQWSSSWPPCFFSTYIAVDRTKYIPRLF